MAREIADAYAAVVHLGRRLGLEYEMHFAEFLGLPYHDDKWVTPWGEDVTDLCRDSLTGGFASARWTMAGWVLDAASMEHLAFEFPGWLPNYVLARMSTLFQNNLDNILENILGFASNELHRGTALALTAQTYVVLYEEAEHAGATLAWFRATAQGDTNDEDGPSCELCGDHDLACRQRSLVVFADLMLYRIHEVLPNEEPVFQLLHEHRRLALHRVCANCNDIIW